MLSWYGLILLRIESVKNKERLLHLPNSKSSLALEREPGIPMGGGLGLGVCAETDVLKNLMMITGADEVDWNDKDNVFIELDDIEIISAPLRC